MKLAFCLFKYFPFGGLQRDFLRIAEACQRRGHSIDVFTTCWEGEVPAGFDVHLLPVSSLTNHGRSLAFGKALSERLGVAAYDAVIGFNKLTGLDVYFAADPCFAAKVRHKHGFLYRLSNRYRIYAALEKAVFGPESATEILLISEVEKPHFIGHYGTAENRFHALPPGICRDRKAPDNPLQERNNFRREFGFSDAAQLLLMVGSGFKTKGLDRSIQALAALPELTRKNAFLLVVGQGDAAPFLRLARKLGVDDHLKFYGGRNDVPRFLFGADLLLQPSYYENTGTAIVEAIVAGLPVLATANCGYAHYVTESNAGLLAPEPFVQEQFNELLLQMLTSSGREAWRRSALDFASRADLFSLPEKAADIIESVALRSHR
ncbi:glycosyltransferase family 4 protein [Geobacter sp.]|uniref:glycosyltransferase family 4 protein n=1 Tax=Geobacter sp. TaxID=46610 RepID=UPI0027BA4947|nr:glycosyltransferase family 4 protein [Geobacter sp.]